MSKRSQPKFGPSLYDASRSDDPLMHRERAHKNWYFIARRVGDKRGHMAHGKAKTQTSGRVAKDANQH